MVSKIKTMFWFGVKVALSLAVLNGAYELLSMAGLGKVTDVLRSFVSNPISTLKNLPSILSQ